MSGIPDGSHGCLLLPTSDQVVDQWVDKKEGLHQSHTHGLEAVAERRASPLHLAAGAGGILGNYGISGGMLLAKHNRRGLACRDPYPFPSQGEF